jgi:hypothetical protein
MVWIKLPSFYVRAFPRRSTSSIDSGDWGENLLAEHYRNSPHHR